MSYTIGLDIGTTNVKGILMSEGGEIIARSSVKFIYDFPAPGYVQIDADRFADNCLTVISELAHALPEGGKITGISQVSASGNLLLLGENLEPITPIYNWQDTRVTDEVDQVLGADFDRQSYYEKTGWRLNIKMPLCQLCFIKAHEPELLKRAKYVCMSTEYLNFLLTGKFGISPSAGTPFFLIDQTTRAYVKEILDVFDISEDMVPPVMNTGAELGQVTPEMCEKLGITEGARVYLGTFDHPGGAISSGITEEGKMLLSCGTSWVAFIPINDRNVAIKNNFLCDPFLSDNGGPWGAMCSIASVGNVVNTLVEKYIGGYDKLTELAEASGNGSGGLVIDQNSIDAPEILSYSKENIAYAIMEMPARLLREKLEIFLASGVRFEHVSMAGGPTKSEIWISIVERILGMSVSVSNAEYSGAVGAAMIARKDS